MNLIKNLLLLLSGIIVGAVLITFNDSDLIVNMSEESNQSEDAKPLYWVAPMNPDFKSDKPGMSPMGMELIPVYDSSGGKNDSSGTVRISPNVVNNLGVRTTTVKYGALQGEINTVGYVQYDEDKLVQVHPRVEGWVEKLYVKASGDPVKQGQALYSLYSPALVNAQEEYLIALRRKNERLIRAAEARLKALQLPARFIQELGKNRQVKQLTTFYAPQSGVITSLNIRQGVFVKPESHLMSIGDLDSVWIQAEIFERQASQVKVGLPVTMTLTHVPGREWLGKVDYIYPTLESSTRTLRVRIRFNNKDRVLMPNMFAQITIHANTDDSVLLLPREAVIRTGTMDRVVLALGDGAFKSVAVIMGRSDDQNIEILEGVSDGDMVVSSAQFLIDSESSKTSDFKRFNHIDRVVQSISVNATINYLIKNQHMVNITHQPIPEWNRPGMTMNFLVDNSVDFSQIQQDMVVNLHIFKNENGELAVKSIKPLSGNDMDDSELEQGQQP